MKIPSHLKYTSDHEWAEVQDNMVTIGVTDYAQGELGDIVFVEFPEIGDNFKSGETFGTIEAVKTVADLFMPISGEIIAINDKLDSDPAKVNSDPYGDGWIIKVQMSNPDEEDGLMSPISYEEMIS